MLMASPSPTVRPSRWKPTFPSVKNAVVRVDEGATLNLKHNANLTGSDIEAYMAFSGGALPLSSPWLA